METSRKRRVAVIECCEEIPCNPCVKACPHGAIHIEGGIHNIPTLDEDKCVGCKICIANCSGQTIFVVEKQEEKGRVSFPYEMLPMPEKGTAVWGTDRDGEVVCEGVITEVMNTKKFDHTAVVTIEIPVDYTDDVRGFRYKKEGE